MPKGDLPEPTWWKHARHLYEQGENIQAIADRFGKAWTTVKKALDKEYRDKHNASRKHYAQGNTLRIRDQKRSDTRAIARDRWREDGKIRSLDSYYRQLECL